MRKSFSFGISLNALMPLFNSLPADSYIENYPLISGINPNSVFPLGLVALSENGLKTSSYRSSLRLRPGKPEQKVEQSDKG
jgi:hypothetical protein